ncbi:MAG: hypothetical protein ABR925_07655, partial [Acidimicrobiales bacterium]
MTSVPNLRHPIATFVVAVVGVIGIGVGVLAAQGSSKVIRQGPPTGTYVVAECQYNDNTSVRIYGPPGFRFAAEFPRPPAARWMRSVPSDSNLTFRVMEIRNGRRRACGDVVIVDQTHNNGSYLFPPRGVYAWARHYHWKPIWQSAGPHRLTVWQIEPVGCNTTGALPGGCGGFLVATDG